MEISPSTGNLTHSLVLTQPSLRPASSAMQIVLRHFHTQFTRENVCHVQANDDLCRRKTAGKSPLALVRTIGNDTCYNETENQQKQKQWC